MALCVYCNKRAGKRACPALGGVICPSCCGQHRGIEISCPISCKYFKTHESYQRDRLAEEFHALWIEKTEPLYRAGKERLIDLIAWIEMLIYQFYRERALGTDGEVREALEFLQRRFGPVMIVEAGGTALANHLWQGLQEFLKKEALPSEAVSEALEKIVEIFGAYANPAQPRKYLHGMLGHVQRYFTLPDELKESPSLITTPHIVTPES
uniref:Uncharacterized protein n=2 Tax=Candidatus Bipolaricaulota TaxID=67810 RepID=H5SJW2_9BACT|nr:hypothetical protein HGMM_F37H05C41 [uncultured Acetothermia bacterium]BAL59530.1 hypothetical protein HGMM_OP4C166 [Candidatus Acetothermum autotrophicum]